jgi:hypothetical protein
MDLDHAVTYALDEIDNALSHPAFPRSRGTAANLHSVVSSSPASMSRMATRTLLPPNPRFGSTRVVDEEHHRVLPRCLIETYGRRCS